MKKIIIGLSALLILGACSNNKQPNLDEEETQKPIEVLDNGIGERHIVNDEAGKESYAITITNVSMVDWDDGEFDEVLAVEYVLENIAYDNDGKQKMSAPSFRVENQEGFLFYVIQEQLDKSKTTTAEHGEKIAGAKYFSLDPEFNLSEAVIQYRSKIDQSKVVFKLNVVMD